MHKTDISEIDSRRNSITPGTDAYSRAAARPLTDADAYLRMYYRRLMRLGYETRRYQIDRREAEVRPGNKAEIGRLEDEYMQVLLSLRSEAQVLLSLRSETVEDAAQVWDDKSVNRYFDDEIQALLTVCLHTLPLDTLIEVPRGHFWADLAIMYSKDASEGNRIEAVNRLSANYFKKPIHWKRWIVIGPAIMQEIARASANKFSSREEFRRRERSSLYVIAQGAVKNIPLRQQEDAIRAVGRALNNAFTEDVLGSDWRRKPNQQEFEDGESGKQPSKLGEIRVRKLSQVEMLRQSSEAEVLRKVELSLILKRSDLTEREAELISLKRRGFSYEEVAARLQASPGTLRTAHHRAIEKLKKLVS